jgi:hypothetical protein
MQICGWNHDFFAEVLAAQAVWYALAMSHCGLPITGEPKAKQAKSGPREYAYYRCA